MSITNTSRFVTAMAVVFIGATICAAAEEGQRERTSAPAEVNVRAEDGNREESSAKHPASLRVITFNTQFLPGVAARFNKRGEPSYRAKAIGRAMAAFEIVGLNEVFDPVHRKELFDELRDAWGDRFHAVTAPREQCSPLGVDSGLAILTQLPVVESHSTPFGNGSSVLQYGLQADGLASKGVLHARLEVRKNQFLDVFVTHLESTDRPIREKQYQLLGEVIRRYAAPAFPVLVMGDLNTSGENKDRMDPTSSYSKLLASLNRARPKAMFVDVWPQLRIDRGGTNAPEMADGGTRIDYILTSASRGVTAPLTPIRVEIEQFADPRTKTLSDHAAVKAVLEYD
jgi:endonuclease/exonuclease/phosphatase family metal-dependent hydrolase